jgi:transposase
MIDTTNDTTSRVLIAIDIAKHNHDLIIRIPEGRKIRMRIPNTLDGYKKLKEQLMPFPMETVLCGFEPTADYHRNIAFWLGQQGAEMRLISSLACARAREMLFKTRDKNDRKDANVILYLLDQGISEPFHDPLVSGIMDVQEICNTYQQIVLSRSRVVHSLLNHSITLFFPEIERFYHNSRSEWWCNFLLKFPTPGSITRYRQQTFVKRAWKVVGRKQNKQRFLEELYEIAGNSTALPVSLDSQSVAMFRVQLSRFLQLTRQRKELETLADGLLEERSDYRRLRTLPGVGPIIALMILAEGGDLRRFKHHRQFLNFCGFNLSAQQSGQQRGRYHLSKRGNARLRYAFWLAANSAIRNHENSFRDKFSRYIKSNPEDADIKRKGRVAVAIKMARVAHSLVKNDCDYRGYHEYGYGM